MKIRKIAAAALLFAACSSKPAMITMDDEQTRFTMDSNQIMEAIESRLPKGYERVDDNDGTFALETTGDPDKYVTINVESDLFDENDRTVFVSITTSLDATREVIMEVAVPILEAAGVSDAEQFASETFDGMDKVSEVGYRGDACKDGICLEIRSGGHVSSVTVSPENAE